MFGRMKPSFVAAVFVVFTFLTVELEAAEVEIGKLLTCSHGVEGTVVAVTDSQIKITDFKYDGKGPGPWFHGQLKGSKQISSEKDFVTLKTVQTECNILAGPEYDGTKEIVIDLPKKITDFESIGILCYEACNNFGYVKVPDSLTGLDAGNPPEATNDCTDKVVPPNGAVKHTCPNDGKAVTNGLIGDKCETPPDPDPTTGMNNTSGGNNGTGTGTGTGTDEGDASKLPSVSGWLVVSLLILFGNHINYQKC